MTGVFLASLAMLFSEVSTVIGKSNGASRKQSVYAMGFLQVFWVLCGFGLITFFIATYFALSTLRNTKENPLKFLSRPLYFIQSATQELSAGLESFAYLFAPASVILERYFAI